MFGLRVVLFVSFCLLHVCTSTEMQSNSTSQIVEERLDYLEKRISEIIEVRNSDKLQIVQIQANFQSQLDQMNETISKLKNRLANITFKEKGPFSDSLILNGKYHQYFHWFPGNTWSICYRGSSDGWSANVFHMQCDKKGSTVTLIRSSDGYIFGGFANISWGTVNTYTAAPGTFVFSFRNKDNLPPFKAELGNPTYNKAILDSPRYGPTFGNGYDIYLDLENHDKGYSYANFGYTFRVPPGYRNRDKDRQALLAGRPYFRLSEVEVFYLK